MNAILRFDTANYWLIAGWTMIHFLWLGTLVGVAAALSRLVLRRASASLRYSITFAWLLALAAIPFATATFLVSRDAQWSAPPSLSTATAMPTVPFSSAAPGYAGVRASGTIANDPTSAEELTPTEPRQSRGLSTSPLSQPAHFLNLVTLADFVTSTIPYLPWLWLIGTPATLGLLLTGIVGSRRLSRASLQISEGPVAAILARLTTSLHITRQVTVAVCDRIAAPVLIGIIRPVILLPPSALTGWSPDEIEMVLLHELAHVRRWDNLVNLLQRFIESLLFFHPAVWIVSTWVRRDRESCCDALVVGRTGRPHAYAEMLVALAAQMPRSVLFHPAASSAMAAGPLRYRIRRILQLEDDPMLVSGKSLVIVVAFTLAIGVLSVLYIPSVGHAEPSTEPDPSAARSASKGSSDADTESIAPTDKQGATAEFPHEVKFERGAHRFLEGDEITIAEVRGTASTFAPGNKYWIRGTYKLKSQDRAQLLAYVIAKENAITPGDPNQSKTVERGSGDFTLVLPMAIDGWPRVTLNPVGGGWEFGGIYFGPGDKVLKKWRDEKQNPNAPQLAFELKQDTAGNVDVYLNGKKINRDELQKSITQYNDWQNKPAKLSADRSINYNAVMGLIDRLETIGIKKLAIDTRNIHVEPSTNSDPSASFSASNVIHDADSEAIAAIDKHDADAEFPHKVKFERGAKRFSNGDEIEIQEVRGTAKTFEPGNKFWIRGTYKLKSQDGASLSAFVTAKESKDGVGSVEKSQSKRVESGEGTFTLVLPMKYVGWPHVSFYSNEDGQGFGGIYFGTGDSVLKKWWDTEGTAKTVASSENTSSLSTTAASPNKETGITLHTGETPQTNSPSAEIRSSSLALTTTVDKDPSGKFPSLEQQKLADLAFQRLGLELEPISADDLKRVKALGYDGGVLVARGSAGNGPTIDAGNLLVGLHVWPTKNLQNVADILSRDDLLELVPLKFYAVTVGVNPDGKSPKDVVVSGRVLVKVDRGFGGGRSDSRSPFADAAGQPTLSPPKKQDDTSTPNPTKTTVATNNNPYQAPTGQQPELQSNPFANNQPAVASDRYNSPASVAPLPRGGAMTGGMPPSGKLVLNADATDRTVVAYEVPVGFQRNVEKYAKEAGIQFLWDQKGRCIFQASDEQQKRFNNLLDSTTDWRKENLTPEALEKPFESATENGYPVLRWRAAGLTLVWPKMSSPVMVKEVAAGSPAAWLDVQPGDALTRIERFAVGSLPEAESIFSTLNSGFNDDKNDVDIQFVRRPSAAGPQASTISPNEILDKSLPLKPIAEKRTAQAGMGMPMGPGGQFAPEPSNK